jgi:hypothetical protein
MTALDTRLRRLETEWEAARACPNQHVRLWVHRAGELGGSATRASQDQCPRCKRPLQCIDIILERVASRDRRP